MPPLKILAEYQLFHIIDDTTSLYNAQSRGTTQIDDVSTWLPPSLHTPWRNVFFEYIKHPFKDGHLRKYNISGIVLLFLSMYFLLHSVFGMFEGDLVTGNTDLDFLI